MSALLKTVEHLYSQLASARAASNMALTKIPSRLSPLVTELKSLENQLRELFIAQASKNMPVAIGAEGQASLSETLDNNIPVHAKAVATSAKIKARPLLSRAHPDRGGDPQKFHLIQQAIQEGDMLYIHMCLHKENFYSEVSLEELADRLTARLTEVQAKPSYKLASLFYSNSSEFEASLEKMLKARIHQLQLQVLGL